MHWLISQGFKNMPWNRTTFFAPLTFRSTPSSTFQYTLNIWYTTSRSSPTPLLCMLCIAKDEIQKWQYDIYYHTSLHVHVIYSITGLNTFPYSVFTVKLLCMNQFLFHYKWRTPHGLQITGITDKSAPPPPPMVYR